jgi:peptide/nickel transport system substrate-binding protein
MNRFSTHILEDIHSCIIEGLTTTDENMKTVPLLAELVPSIENGLVQLRPDGGMDVTWKLRAGIKWHDGHPFTSADVKFTVDAMTGWNPRAPGLIVSHRRHA